VKPDEAYQALGRLYGDVRRLELFARRKRPGWTVWGNEVVDLVPAAAD
jgi:N6-adenosine-specific RNA methylase IME4